MKILLAVLFVLCLATIVTSHRKDKDEVKKIVKVIEFDDDVVEGRSSIGRKGNEKFSSSSSSSSWSSEELPRRGNRRPFPRRRRPQRPTEVKKACDDGWLEFKRPNGIWCILIGNPGITNGWFSQQDAQNACIGMGAVLTGFQNSNERMTVAEEALKLTTKLGRTVAGLWVGATSLPGCRSPSCGPYNTFQWTDGDTTGVEGIKWGVGEPDNNNWPGATACIQQFIISPNFVAGPEDFAGWKPAFRAKTMKLPLAVLLVLCLATVVTSHRKDKDEVKKIVKVIEFDDDVVEERSSIGRKGNEFRSSSSSASWSSEEHPRRGNRRPFPGRRPQRLTETKETCDDGWLQFRRPNGVWCILIGNPGVTNGYFSQQDAQNACIGMGAVLTGFQNENERMTVAAEALKLTTRLGRTVAGLWVGATNLPGCKVSGCGPLNTFQWTDGDTTGTEGFKWGIGEPDNTNWPGATACIQQFIISPNFVPGPGDSVNWKPAFVNGDLDKYQCNSRVHPWMRLYICGKRGVRK
ncbi:hypothetical protein B9Z55_020884 [Caenorhabditis nigoni]|uniref:C-type lectin domain-containing protein n=1 Tax=Caenorhabditis nigoni TaxID=1611254 RepID=A0A2G5TPJ1_9PELO|nr:hypothetical protein B9Z55_020884 [Caenorhabditis nigoni]